MPVHQLQSFIDQFTEYPLLTGAVEERLAWMRGWTSWREVKLDGFSLEHLFGVDYERTLRTSFLTTVHNPDFATIGDAIRNIYAELELKLNLLSLVSGEGFGIISVHPRALAVSREPWLLRFLERQYWKVYKRSKTPSVYQGDSKGIVTGTIDLTQRQPSEISAPGYPMKSFEVVGDIREDIVKRNASLIRIADIENDWKVAYSTFQNLESEEKNRLTRGIDLFRASRPNRDLYSRYVIMWTALDSSTPAVHERNSVLKSKKMNEFLGDVSGVEDMEAALTSLRRMRNDISHSHPVDSAQCKTRLVQLEWLFQCSMRKRLGLRELHAKLSPFKQIKSSSG